MRIEKTKIVDLSMVYVTAELHLGGRRYLAAVSEARGERAYIIDPETNEYAQLWEGDTGVMNVIQVPDRDQILVITKFYPIFQSREAAICALEPTEQGYMAPWKIREVMPLPFCHRIGIVQNRHGVFVIGCQLCHDKEFQEDWSQPGALWMAPIPDRMDGEWKLTKLYDGLTKNHGLWIEDGNQVYICAENGVLRFDLSDYRAGESAFPTMITLTPTGDISIAEMHGQKYAATIEPFHGDSAAVYRLTDTAYEQIARFDINFGHVVWIGELFGKPSLILGSRGGEKQLEIVDLETGTRTVLEEGVGPTQISIYPDGDTYKILAANHGAGEVTIYTLYKA